MYYKNQKGFTFVEILLALAVIGVLFVPVMQLFSNSLYATSDSLDMITASSLAQSEMERTLNLNMTTSQLMKEGEKFSPALREPPFEINHTKWRVKREVVAGAGPVEVRIHVYREEDLNRDVVVLVTLMEDMMWESVKQVK